VASQFPFLVCGAPDWGDAPFYAPLARSHFGTPAFFSGRGFAFFFLFFCSYARARRPSTALSVPVPDLILVVLRLVARADGTSLLGFMRARLSRKYAPQTFPLSTASLARISSFSISL
jgi:hypothetical protein